MLSKRPDPHFYQCDDTRKWGKAGDDHYVKKRWAAFCQHFFLPMSEFLYEHMFVHRCTYTCMYYYTFLCERNTFSHIFRMYYISFWAKKSNLPRNVTSRKENVEGKQDSRWSIFFSFWFSMFWWLFQYSWFCYYGYLPPGMVILWLQVLAWLGGGGGVSWWPLWTHPWIYWGILMCRDTTI